MEYCDMKNHPGVGMAYVPWQSWEDIYDPSKALCCGTLFMSLNKPFIGYKCV